MSNRKMLVAIFFGASTLAACSGPDFAGLQQQHVACGTNPAQFVQPEVGTIGPTPPGDVIGYDADPARQQCLLDWAREHGFTVMSADDVQNMMNQLGQ